MKTIKAIFSLIMALSLMYILFSVGGVETKMISLSVFCLRSIAALALIGISAFVVAKVEAAE